MGFLFKSLGHLHTLEQKHQKLELKLDLKDLFIQLQHELKNSFSCIFQKIMNWNKSERSGRVERTSDVKLKVKRKSEQKRIAGTS